MRIIGACQLPCSAVGTAQLQFQRSSAIFLPLHIYHHLGRACMSSEQSQDSSVIETSEGRSIVALDQRPGNEYVISIDKVDPSNTDITIY